MEWARNLRCNMLLQCKYRVDVSIYVCKYRVDVSISLSLFSIRKLQVDTLSSNAVQVWIICLHTLFIIRKLQVDTLKLYPPPSICIVSRTHRHSPSIFENVDSCCIYTCTSLLLLLHAKLPLVCPDCPQYSARRLLRVGQMGWVDFSSLACTMCHILYLHPQGYRGYRGYPD